jgi:hypothetical protein
LRHSGEMEKPEDLEIDWVEVTQVIPPHTGLEWYACSIAPQKQYCSSCIIKRLKSETPGLSKRQYSKIEKQIAKDYELMMASEKAEAQSAGE